MVVVLIVRLMHSWCLRYKSYAHKNSLKSFSSRKADWTKSNHLSLLLHSTAIVGYNTLAIPTWNKRLTTGKQVNCSWVRVGQGEGKLPQTEHTHGNSGVLTLYISFYAKAMVQSMSIMLAFMLKELSRHASCDTCHSQLEFSDNHLVYYMLIILQFYNNIFCR